MPKRQFRFIHRDIIILLGLCALAVVAFLVTRDSAASNRELFLRDAAIWYETGLRAFDESNSNESIQALRRATAMSGGNQEYQLALARALALSGQDDVARAELLALRELSPEAPEIKWLQWQWPEKSGNNGPPDIENKTALLSITAFGNNETDVVAAYVETVTATNT